MTSREHPILFTAPMVRAILDGTKTETRRLPRLPRQLDGYGPWGRVCVGSLGVSASCDRLVDVRRERDWVLTRGALIDPPYAPGDRLWVRESWAAPLELDGMSPTAIANSCLEAGYKRPWAPLWYLADSARRDNEATRSKQGKARRSIHMPRWASRITLDVIDVHPERLHDIDDDGALREGFSDCDQFAAGWDAINGDRRGGSPWAANPVVWVIAFRRVR